MPLNSQSVGKDIGFTFSLPTGNLTLNGVTDYDIKPMTTELKHKGINGITRYGYMPDGWSISVKLERRDPNLDRYFAQLEAAYFAGVNVQPGTVTETISETDGTISQYQYTGVVLKYDDAGNWKGDAYIATSITAMASRRIQVV